MFDVHLCLIFYDTLVILINKISNLYNNNIFIMIRIYNFFILTILIHMILIWIHTTTLIYSMADYDARIRYVYQI